MVTGWAYGTCPEGAGAQGCTGSLQFHTGSGGISGSCDLVFHTASMPSKANSLILTGNLHVSGNITAHNYTVVNETVTNLYASGSTKFGDTLDDTHQFTGSILVSGTFTLSGAGPGKVFEIETNDGDKAFTVDNNGSDSFVTINAGNGSITTVMGSHQVGQALRIDDTGVMFNDDANEHCNFRVESQHNAHMIFVDAGTSKVGIGTATPGNTLEVLDASSSLGTAYPIAKFKNSNYYCGLALDAGTGYDARIEYQEAGVKKWDLGNDENPEEFRLRNAAGNKFLHVTQAGLWTMSSSVVITDDLTVCNGTASILHLSGCSPITVHAPMSSSTWISASNFFGTLGSGSESTTIVSGNLLVCDGTASISNLSGCSPIQVHAPMQMQSGDSFSFNGSDNTAKITNQGQNLDINAPQSVVFNSTLGITSSLALISGSQGTSEYLAYGGAFQVTESYGGKLTLGAYGSPYLQAQHYYATSSAYGMEIGPFNKLAIVQDGQISLSASANANPMLELPAGINLVCNPGNGIVAVETNRVSFQHNTASLSSNEQEYLWSINSDHTGDGDESAWVKLDVDSKEFVVGAADNIKLVAQDIAASSLTASGRVTCGDIRTAGGAIAMGGDIFGMGTNLDGVITIVSASNNVGFIGEVKSGIVLYGTPNPSPDLSVKISVDGIQLAGGTSSFNYSNVAAGTPNDANSYLAVDSFGKVIKSSAASVAGSDGQLLFNQNGAMGANSQYTVDGSGSMTIGSGGGTLYVRNKLDVPQITSSFNPGANGQSWQLGYGDGSEGGSDSGGALSFFASSSAQGVDGYMSFFTADSASYTDGGGSDNYKRVQINNAMKVNGDLQVGSINNHASASISGVNWKLNEGSSRALAFFTGSGGASKDYLAFSASAEHPAVTVGVTFRLTEVEEDDPAGSSHYLVLNSDNEVVRTGAASVAGSDTQVQVNNNGAFAGSSNFTYSSGSVDLGAALNINGSSNLTVNNITNNGSNNQIWTLRDGIDGLSPGGNNGALMFFTGSGSDFMKFHTSGSAKGIVFGQQTYLNKGGSLSGTLAGGGSFLAIDSNNMVVLATPPAGGGGSDCCVFREIDASNAYSTSSISIGGGHTPEATLHVSSSGDEVLLQVDSLNQGTVLFVTGAGAYNGRVGIGTTTPDYELDVYGNITFGNGTGGGYLLPRGDVDTFLRFGPAGADSIRLQAGGVNFIELDENGLDWVLFNSASADVDFQVRTQNNTASLFVEGSTDRVGIGTSSPKVELHVIGDLSVCEGTASILHLSGCSPVTVHSDMVFKDASLYCDAFYPPDGISTTTYGMDCSQISHFRTQVTASCSLYVTDRVGINTSTPLVALDVHYSGSANPVNGGLGSKTGGGDVVYYGTGSSQAGAVYYLNEDGGWAAAQATDVRMGTGQLGIALGAKATDGMLIRGFANIDTFFEGTMKAGKVLYVSQLNPGYMSHTAPTGSGEILRLTGHATSGSSNVIHFNPEVGWLELV